MASFSSPVATENKTPTLFLGGKDLFESILSALQNARDHIHLQMYIFSNDLTGKKVEVELIKAVERGVKVFVILDSFGSKELPEEILTYWRRSGIRVRMFSPLFGKNGLRIRRRLHVKIICVDGRIGFTGGVNISDRYSGFNNEVPWLDHMVKLEGPAIFELEKLCRIYWGQSRRAGIPIAPALPSNGLTKVAVLRNDRMLGKAEIARAYRTALRNANESVIIFASYFLPGSRFRKEIRKAAKRKVKIVLVLPGRSDVEIADHAMRYLYPWLFRCGVEIYEWNRSVLHSKVMMVDRSWMTVGSFNINHLSDFSSVEVNVEILDSKFVNECAEESMRLILRDCKQVSETEFTERHGIWNRWMDKAAYVIVRFLFRFLYFLTSRE